LHTNLSVASGETLTMDVALPMVGVAPAERAFFEKWQHVLLTSAAMATAKRVAPAKRAFLLKVAATPAARALLARRWRPQSASRPRSGPFF